MLDNITQHLKSEGYCVDSVIPDGKVHRFSLDQNDKKSSGFYIAYRNFSSKTGEEFYIVVYGSWRSSETKTYCSLVGTMSKEDKKLVNAQIQALQKKESELRLKEQELIAAQVQDAWDALSDTGTSEYLTNKKIDGIGVKYDGFGNIYVPARDVDGRLWSYQRIGPDGSKWFHPGGRIRGCFHTLGNINGTDDVFIAEGFATAASIYLATGIPTIAAYHAGNLLEVSKSVKRLHPNKSVTICGDDDRFKDKNVGRKKAEEAAKICLGTAIFPIFKGNAGTDYNDLHVQEGLEEVSRQLAKQEERPKTYLLSLGFKEKEYFFTSSENQTIVAISSFSKVELLKLMKMEYWEAIYPGSGASRVCWDDAASSLINQCHAKGIFESQNIRGAGVWNDDGRVVVNMGDHLVVEGNRIALGEIASRYFYTLGRKMPGVHPSPLSADECELITEAAHLFRWKQPDFGYLVAGAMVTSRLCGALPVRPHLWVTGSAGQGKSTLFDRFIYPLLGEPIAYFAGNTTEAGIRQELYSDSIPVLFDEFENNGPQSVDRIQSILDLLRVAWSETKASIVKGGSTGNSTKYRARFSAIVTSIRQIALNDADRSRFATVELRPHGDDKEHWESLKSLLVRIDEEMGNRLYARGIKLLPVLLQNFKTMKKAMKGGQRFTDQYGMLLAGYGILLQDEPMNDSQAQFLAAQVCLEEEKDISQITDQEMALTHLLTTKYSYESGLGKKDSLISELLLIAKSEPATNAEKALLQLGIRIDSETSSVVIANSHAELEARVFRGTRWSNSWSSPLSRLVGAEKTQLRVNGKTTRCVKIPMEHLVK